MSKHVHCDECDGFMYKTAPGTVVVPAQWRFNAYEFCSERCLKRHVILNVLHFTHGEAIDELDRITMAKMGGS